MPKSASSPMLSWGPGKLPVCPVCGFLSPLWIGTVTVWHICFYVVLVQYSVDPRV